MSVLLVLLMFMLVMILGHFLRHTEQRYTAAPKEKTSRSSLPYFETKLGMEVPRRYFFHPCHTWAVDEGWQLIRVGIDEFAANVFGKVDQISVTNPNRWVRQGQKLMTITVSGISVDLPSPIEGTVKSVNGAALENPDLVTTDPFCKGWMAVIKAASFDTDQKNLMQGAMVAPWMRNSMVLLRDICSQSPALAQDGGRPITGVLKRVSPELRKKLVKEFFLTVPAEEVQPASQHL
jgi:glycine cleavage system H lipoate-binding protein